jgi:hypothetical protein
VRTALLLALLLPACAGAPAGPATTTADVTSSAGDGDSRWTGEAPAATTTAGDPTTGGVDLPSEGFHCDPRRQDCPAGSKCAPFSSSMVDPDWDGARCVPLVDDPADLGEACETQQFSHSGLDDCGPGLLCWYFEGLTDLRGRCLGLCGPDNSCADPDARCYVQPEASFLCYPLCDPLAQDCPPPATLCVRSSGVDGFLCRYPSAGAPAGPQMPCTREADCAPGHVCDPSDLVSGCPGERCCAPLCALSQPSCPPELPSCQPYDPTPPAEYADLGVCRAP